MPAYEPGWARLVKFVISGKRGWEVYMSACEPGWVKFVILRKEVEKYTCLHVSRDGLD
jgi:hypothetical protein